LLSLQVQIQGRPSTEHLSRLNDNAIGCLTEIISTRALTWIQSPSRPSPAGNVGVPPFPWPGNAGTVRSLPTTQPTRPPSQSTMRLD